MEGDRTEIELPVEDWTFPAKDVPPMTKSTIIEEPKFAPVTVTRVLPPCGPPNGETLKIDGRGNAVGEDRSGRRDSPVSMLTTERRRYVVAVRDHDRHGPHDDFAARDRDDLLRDAARSRPRPARRSPDRRWSRASRPSRDLRRVAMEVITTVRTVAEGGLARAVVRPVLWFVTRTSTS